MSLFGFVKKVSGIEVLKELKEAKELHDSGVQRQKEVQDAMLEKTRTVSQRVTEASGSINRATKA